ncbi:MAG TPA: hypothetical protein VLA24_03985 [Pseudomonadales bacterium]|nr:hypothetical protein [Pseudomonadales bacterium]
MTMLTEQAHMLTWAIYFAGVALGLLVLGHVLQRVERSFVRMFSRALYLGILLAPVSTDAEKMFFSPAIMQAALSAMAGKVEPMLQALVSIGGTTLVALLLAITYYLMVHYKKKSV